MEVIGVEEHLVGPAFIFSSGVRKPNPRPGAGSYKALDFEPGKM
jgi:hypothetical protein